MGNVVTRFPGGVGNRAEAHMMGDLPFPDPTLWHTFFDDFNSYVAADWVVTETQAGATQALTAGNGGLLLLTNSAADNDQNTIAKTPAAFTLDATKKSAFRARFKIDDVTQSDLVVGLVVIDTALPSAGRTDGIYFYSDDESAALNVTVRKNATTGANSAAAIATLANDTFLTVEWYYDGAGTLVYGVNGVLLGRLTADSTYFPDAAATVTFALQNGSAAARSATIDYLFAAQER